MAYQRQPRLLEGRHPDHERRGMRNREMKQVVFRGVKLLLRRAGLQVQVFSSGMLIPLPLWENDRTFNGIWNQISGHTLVDRRRCFMLYQYARQTHTLPGDAAEVGV